MKSVEFGEDRLGDLESLAQELFCDCQDPRSNCYRRVLHRPKIRWWKILLYCLTVLCLCGGVYALLRDWGLGPWPAAGIALAVMVGILLMLAKRILICLVRIYQRYAPDSIRNKCRFEPSCSQYMILSLEKYGLRKGLTKGIDRLKRCNVNDGGFDEP